MQKILIEFFAGVLEGDEKILSLVDEYKGDMSFDAGSKILIFKLKDLYGLLFDPNEIDFSTFRKLIYQGNLNSELVSLGGKVEVHQSVGKLNDNYYKLVKLEN